MKVALLILTFVLLCVFCRAQDTIGLSFDPVKKDFKDNTKSIEFRSGVSYRILISGLNTAVIDYKITSKSYTLTSSIPEILKPVFPGISEEFAFDFLKPEQGRRDIQTVASYTKKMVGQSRTRYSQLCQLKDLSDALYKSTKNQINRGQAGVVLKNAEDIFKVKSLDALRKQVSLNSNYIMVTREILKKIMEKDPTDENITSYVNLNYMADSIKSVNFLSCVNFIENSQKARDYIEYTPFKAEKDLVDLRVIFTDKYTEDTIYNSSLPFYTSRNLSFDFSSGFFLNFIHEDLYYLEKRDSLTNNVLPENNSATDISIGALGHLSWKFTSWFKAGISLGAALSPFDAKTRYLIGSSAIFGREKQLGINLGCALARMDHLSTKVREDTSGKYLSADIKDIPTYKKIQPGLYIGITYNLISGKK